jgi:hypothetical protein
MMIPSETMEMAIQEIEDKKNAHIKALEEQLKEAENIVVKCAYGLGGELDNKMQAKKYCIDNVKDGEIFQVDVDEYQKEKK